MDPSPKHTIDEDLESTAGKPKKKRGRPIKAHNVADTAEQPRETIQRSKVKKREVLQLGKPLTGKIRHCMCRQPNKCREIMTRWCRIKEDNGRVGYLNLPLEVTKAKDTLNARHVIAFRRGVMRYLYGEDATDVAVDTSGSLPPLPGEENEDDLDQESLTQDEDIDKFTKHCLPKDKRIAFCHFHPKVVTLLLKEKEQCMFKRYKWRIPIALGEEIGLLPQDICPDPDANGEPSYFALPNYSLESAVADVAKAEQSYADRLDVFKISHTRLAERIAAHPSKYAMEIVDLREQNTLLTSQVQELKSKLKTEQALRMKAEIKIQAMENRLSKTKHRLQKVVETKKHAVPRGRPPKLNTAEPNPSEQQFMTQQFMDQPLPPPFDMENTIPILPEWAIPPNNNAIDPPLPQLQGYNHISQYNPTMLTTHDEKWEFRFQQLLEYHAQFGNCNVPRKWEVNKSLGKWVDNQRVMHSQGRLAQNRFERLNEIGFYWGKSID
ncbi:hypothetical protein HJC23_013195 [Cyclotella cryptica]|uniref:Helicase-associated domain-containing protein n=1 Tax=Cyclotella cryptica TaxID=29204 RepID=A0ABD3QCU9_9STRA|eukprot:CCRYP_006617-RA/>CCRYP_006617-RA protein AED:0.01 eAED:0.01 QI:159/1/1/1/1/1/2/586/493